MGVGFEEGVVDLPPLSVEWPRRVGAGQHGCGLVGEDDVAAFRMRVEVRVRGRGRVRGKIRVEVRVRV